MQRIAATAVITLKHLQTIKKGSVLILAGAGLVDDEPPPLPTGVDISPSAAFVAIFFYNLLLLFFSAKFLKFHPWKKRRRRDIEDPNSKFQA